MLLYGAEENLLRNAGRYLAGQEVGEAHGHGRILISPISHDQERTILRVHARAAASAGRVALIEPVEHGHLPERPPFSVTRRP